MLLKSCNLALECEITHRNALTLPSFKTHRENVAQNKSEAEAQHKVMYFWIDNKVRDAFDKLR